MRHIGFMINIRLVQWPSGSSEFLIRDSTEERLILMLTSVQVCANETATKEIGHISCVLVVNYSKVG